MDNLSEAQKEASIEASLKKAKLNKLRVAHNTEMERLHALSFGHETALAISRATHEYATSVANILSY